MEFIQTLKHLAFFHWGFVMANARLMAYAPQMLELLIEMYRCDKLEQRRRTSMSLLFDDIKGIKR